MTLILMLKEEKASLGPVMTLILILRRRRPLGPVMTLTLIIREEEASRPSYDININRKKEGGL